MAAHNYTNKQQLHFLMFPLPEHGHSTPMLSLASQLAALGNTVTFLTAEKGSISADDDISTLIELNPCSTESVRFLTLRSSHPSSSMGSSNSARFAILMQTLSGLEERQAAVEKVVQDSKASSLPIACIICDVFIWSWVHSLSKRQAIGAVLFLPTCTLNFYRSYLLSVGNDDEFEKINLQLELEALKPKTEAGNEEESRNARARRRAFVERLYRDIKEASHILVNSFTRFEAQLLPSLQSSGLNVRLIGPCLPAWEHPARVDALTTSIARQAGCLFKEDESCIAWLDRQEKGSVLFVSFGSEVNPEGQQVEELAMGLESSGHKFLWVVRADVPPHNQPPKGFEERTADRGLLVSWVPQRRVLQHPSIAGFLTHCGWNSIIESILFGVPMLCFPLNGDQHLNVQVVCRLLKVGMRLDNYGVVQREEVEKRVRALMEGDAEIHHQSKLLQKDAQQAYIHESHDTLVSFVRDIHQNVHS